MAAAAEIEEAKIRAGLVNANDLAYRDHQARPLSEHLKAWADSLSSKGSTPEHIELSTVRARRVVAIVMGAALADIEAPRNGKRADIERAEANLVRWVAPARLSDLDADRAQKALATLKAEGRSLGTCNHYRTAIRSFSRWCHDTHRTREDGLRGVKGFNAKEDRRHDRRTLSLDELHKLIEAAGRGPDVMGMTGPARALCYRLAASTGLRYSEIASIRPASFDWKAPSVTVAAGYTKNGDPATLPLPSDLADDLAPYVASLVPGTPVFRLPEGKGAEMLRVDLAAAKIAYRDDAGLVFDFHSLRCETATLADAAGVTPRVVQKLMRHSSLELTGRYTRPRAVDIEAAASMLPSLRPAGDGPEALALTGTGGDFAPRHASDSTDPAEANPGNTRPEGPSHQGRLAPSLRHFGDGLVRAETLPGGMIRREARMLTNAKPLVTKGFDASGRSGTRSDGNDRAGTRTQDQRIKSPLLYRLSYPVSDRFQITSRASRRPAPPVADSTRPVLARDGPAGDDDHAALDRHGNAGPQELSAMAQLGIVTYNIARDWDLDTIFKKLEALGYEGVELRTTHAHKVEVDLSPARRDEIRKRFEESVVQLAGLGSTFEYQSQDPAVVRANIDGTRKYVRFAHDLGAPGIKVRPNGIPKGADREATLRQIGHALHEVAEDAAAFGIEIRVEVHGAVTQELEHFAQILHHANHPNVFACWNSNPTDVTDGSIKSNFALVADRIREVHLRDLTDESYPWRQLFALLKAQNYQGFTLAEIPESRDPDRVLRYFRALWMAYQPA